MSDTSAPPSEPLPTAEEAMHLTLDAPSEDAVPYVQLEHEFAGFETVKLTRLHRLIAGALEEQVRGPRW